MLNHPDVKRFIELVTGWNCAGWGEYLLYETLEGTRSRPFALLDPLPAEDLEVCRRLRDEHKIWPFWDASSGTWDVVSIHIWRPHALETTADDIRRRIEKH